MLLNFLMLPNNSTMDKTLFLPKLFVVFFTYLTQPFLLTFRFELLDRDEIV